MPGLLLLLLIFIPAVEIYLFIEIGGAIGGGWTFMLILLTGFWGLGAMRRQGLTVLAEAQQAQARGDVPVAALAHGILILLGGLLLVIPGFFTDTLGFILMLRWGRLLVIESLLSAILPSLTRGFQMRRAANEEGAPSHPTPRPTPPDTIEGDFIVHDDPASHDEEK